MPASLKFPYPIVDHHAHLRPGPSGLQAAREFAALGGTHLFLATQNYAPRAPRTLDAYRAQFMTTEEIAARVRSETGVQVYCVLAPYPIDLVHIAPEIGLAQAEALQIDALELAAKEVREHRAVALGEVGRAHFPVDAPEREALDRVLVRALELAREVGCPTVLHTEDLTPEGYRLLADEVRRVGLPVERAVKHYARAYAPPEDRAGLSPSFLAKRDLVATLEARTDPGPWFLETDFLDDPARPGVALPLTSVPKRVRAHVAKLTTGSAEEVRRALERWEVPFVHAPRKVYGLELMREHPLELTAAGPGGT